MIFEQPLLSKTCKRKQVTVRNYVDNFNSNNISVNSRHGGYDK